MKNLIIFIYFMCQNYSKLINKQTKTCKSYFLTRVKSIINNTSYYINNKNNCINNNNNYTLF